MLKKVNRISKRKEIEEVRKVTVKYQSPIFGMLILDKKDDEKKFMFLISKKISKRAVDRNRIKRLLSEAIRLNFDKIKKGMRVVFLVKKSILGKGMEEIKREVEKGLIETEIKVE